MNENEILIPIGADTLVKGKILDNSKVIINIGAGISLEEPTKTGIEKLTSRIEKIETNRNRIAETINNLQDQAIRLSQSVEQRYQEIQQAQGDPARLWVKGELDGVIRTGGTKRASGFCTYQTGYSEWFFTDIMWPDMTPTLFYEYVTKIEESVGLQNHGK